MARKRKPALKRRFGSIRQKGARFTVAFTAPDGKRHSPGKSFATAKQAELWLAKEEALIEQHNLGYVVWVPPQVRNAQDIQSSVTVAQWLDTFHENLEHRPKPPRPSTMQNYRRVTSNRITDPLAPGDKEPDVTRLADIQLVKLTKNDVYRWWDGLQRAYPTAHTINQQAYKRLKAACDEATRREMIPFNPVEIREAGKKVAPKEKYLPSDEELNAIYAHVPEQYRVLTSLMLFHGLRIGEAIALEQRHVHVEEQPGESVPRVVVQVEQNAQRVRDDDGKIYMMVQPPKTEAGYRSVPIMPQHVPDFLRHLKEFAPTTTTTVETLDRPRAVNLLTATRTGQIVMDTSYRSVLERAEIKAGVTTEIDPHCGRNWLITRLAEQGAHLKEIGQLLGQDDVQTILNVYMKVRAGRTTSLMDKVNSSLAPGAPGGEHEGLLWTRANKSV